MVYQQFVNYPSLTVYENIASPLRMERMLERPRSIGGCGTTAEILHIDSLLDRLPAQLSGGQQQRTAIARALIKGADLLLLDEPLVNLDYKLREELRAEMREIFAERAVTVVYATTEPAEALMLGGEVDRPGRGPRAAVRRHGRRLSSARLAAGGRGLQRSADEPSDGELAGGMARLSAAAAPLPRRRICAASAAGRYRSVCAPIICRSSRRPSATSRVPADGRAVGDQRLGDLRACPQRRPRLVVQHEGVHGYELGQPVRSISIRRASTPSTRPARLSARPTARRLGCG